VEECSVPLVDITLHTACTHEANLILWLLIILFQSLFLPRLRLSLVLTRLSPFSSDSFTRCVSTFVHIPSPSRIKHDFKIYYSITRKIFVIALLDFCVYIFPTYLSLMPQTFYLSHCGKCDAPSLSHRRKT
jgi:hypothetical protein